MDRSLRDAERAASDGDLRAQVALLRERMRSGELPQWKVEVAAWCGDSAAEELFPNWIACLGTYQAWLRHLGRQWGCEAELHALLGMVPVMLRDKSLVGTNVPVVLTQIEHHVRECLPFVGDLPEDKAAKFDQLLEAATELPYGGTPFWVMSWIDITRQVVGGEPCFESPEHTWSDWSARPENHTIHQAHIAAKEAARRWALQLDCTNDE